MEWNELVEKVTSLLREVGEWDCETAAYNLGVENALEEVENVCATWRNTPGRNGLYWVEGEGDPRVLFFLNGEWFLSPRDEGEVSEPLGGRLVCEVLGRPS